MNLELNNALEQSTTRWSCSRLTRFNLCSAASAPQVFVHENVSNICSSETASNVDICVKCSKHKPSRTADSNSEVHEIIPKNFFAYGAVNPLNTEKCNPFISLKISMH